MSIKKIREIEQEIYKIEDNKDLNNTEKFIHLIILKNEITQIKKELKISTKSNSNRANWYCLN
ncbi:hypothetical protein [Tenacibaculum sp. nBUS_03]|uniref:hypothetical protein n=1 Tax=Tenacibaculum sp. nBUS_03 TaxID=3395320 RepID=UPI003EBDC989